MSVLLSQLKPFQKKCPYQLISMFNTNENEDLSNYLVYEVFPCDESTQSFESFLKELKKAFDDDSELASSMQDRASKLQFLEYYTDVADDYYKKLWGDLDGAEKKRFLLYPVNASKKEKRLPDELYGQYSEIAVLRELIEQSGIYTWSEKSHSNWDNGSYSWYIRDQFKDQYIIQPCCPKCRTLLPDRWFDKIDDLIPIGLVAPYSGGKTTYMTSLLMGGFVPLLSDIGAGRWAVADAISDEKKYVPVQKVRYDNVERLSKGLYPNATDPNKKLPPVMFRMSSKGKTVIVAIYDCAGERFQLNDGNQEKKRENLQFLSHMTSIIYFMEAAQIKKDNLGKQFIDAEPDLQPPAQQAQDQARSNEMAYASDILHREDAFDMFIHVQSKIKDMEFYGITSHLKHVAFTVIKSDELKELGETLPNGFSMYLDNPSMLDNQSDLLFNADYCQSITYDVADFINEFFGDGKTIDNLLYGNHLTYSCHCVSVAPKVERASGKECIYRPVRIAEPLAACLLDQFN